ncbi:MAG: DUF4292 domain-containing protein [bacterium]
MLLACAGSKEVAVFQPAKISQDALLDSLAQKDQRLDDIMGRMSITIETPTMESSFSADYYFSAPDSFRANIRGLLGTTPGALVSIGDSTVAYFPGKGTLFVAVADSIAENPVLGLDIQFKDLIRAVSGIFGREDGDSLVSFENLGGSYELLYHGRGEFTRVEVLPSRWVLSSKQVYNESGTSLLDIGYSSFAERDGFTRAGEITIVNPMRNEKVTVTIDKEFIGRELPKKIFELDVPEDVIVHNLL